MAKIGQSEGHCLALELAAALLNKTRNKGEAEVPD